MINITAEFWSGPNGALFRVCRKPEKIKAYILYVPPLFEEANRHRHVYTRSAISAYDLGFSSIIYDPIGTGDSQKNLIEVTLAMWQTELLAQVIQIKKNTDQPLVLSLATSAVFMLTTEIINQVDVLHFWQPEFNGKRFVQQFKRLALAQDLMTNNVPLTKSDDSIVEIAGYRLQKQLLTTLSLQSIDSIFVDISTEVKCIYFELLNDVNSELSLSRKNQYQKLNQLHKNTSLITVPENKYWQATELLKPEALLASSLQHLQEVVHDC